MLTNKEINIFSGKYILIPSEYIRFCYHEYFEFICASDERNKTFQSFPLCETYLFFVVHELFFLAET